MTDILTNLLPNGVSSDEFYIALSGVAAGFVVYMVGNTYLKRDTMNARVKALHQRRAELKGQMTAARKRKKTKGSVSTVREIVSRMKLLQESQVGKLKHNLYTAGWKSKDAIYLFAFAQFILPFLFLGAALLLMPLDFSIPLQKNWKLIVPLLAAYVGLKFPTFIVARRRKKRYANIQKGLPDALDLMMICAEAGLSLAAALDRVSRELRLAYPDLAEELSITSIELGFLPDRKTALVNLASRVELQEVRGISSVLIQTEKYGTPISQALRVLASEFRTQRMLRAEQKAARLPAIMTVPMILFILPTLFIVIIAPAAIKVMENWK